MAAVDRWLHCTVTTIYRQVLLYMILLDQGRLAAVDRWLYGKGLNGLRDELDRSLVTIKA